MTSIYRVLRPLSTGQQPGQLVSGEKFKPNVLAALLRVKALKEAQGPPLTELPGWERRSQRLAEIDIFTVADLLRADPERVRRHFGHRKASTAAGWQTEATRWLVIEDEQQKKKSR